MTVLFVAAGIIVSACGIAAECWLARRSRRKPVPPPRLLAASQHASVKARMRGPIPRDGRPLDAYEARILGQVSLDSLIDVREPDYSRRRRP